MIKFRVARGLAFSVSAVAMAVSTTAIAQDTENKAGQPTGVMTNDTDESPEAADISNTDAEGNTDEGAIVVTGSRIQRNSTYSSISPIQVLETEALQDVGDFDAAEILQKSEASAGTQIDATFGGFVLNNGPNSSTLDLRGLGAERTLLLVNGRRLAPAGVEGAPTSPSINLLPSSLIARYDLLLEGASSVYGSDAVAGVGNIILRKDLDGLELFASGNYNPQGGGRDWQTSFAYGKRGTNWQFGVGGEYSRRGEIQLQDRRALAGCDRHYEITDTGEYRTVDISTQANVINDSGGTVTTGTTECKVAGYTARAQINGTYFGNVYFDPRTYPNTGGPGNSFIPGFSESGDAFLVPVDRNGDGIQDINFFDYEINNQDQDVTFVSPQDLYNVMAYGEYTFDGDMNLTPFFEANYSRAEVKVSNSGHGSLFPWVPATNAFNPCNISSVGGVRINPNGVDCRKANNVFEGFVPPSPYAVYALGTGTSVAVRPSVSIRGDRQNVETVQEQYRGVLGLKGDLPFINLGAGNDWTFELAGVYTHSKGTSVRRGIRGDKLAFALGIDPTADYNANGTPDDNGDGIAEAYDYNLTSPPLIGGACNAAGLRNPQFAAPDLLAGCVPVNLFAASLYQPTIGTLGSQAESDYLFGERTFDTTYDQTLVSAYVQGSVFELPGGTAKAVLGGEFRHDYLNSQPDYVAANGLFWGYFTDFGAKGSKDTHEVFGELDLPLISNQPAAQSLNLNLSGRATHDEFYGWNETYSVKLGWRPIEQLLLKVTTGTSFRAPNLRENFLGGISGFGSIVDPCAVPAAAYSGITGYKASADNRQANVIANCVREGRDPFRVGIQPGLNSLNTASVETYNVGSLGLEPETSKSFTTGFAFQENFGPVNFNFNFNYYNIRVSNAIAQLTSTFVVNQCFNAAASAPRSAYCDDISYQTDTTGRLLINRLDRGFVNINRERVRGMDFNANFGYDARMFNEDVRFGLNLRANHLLNRTTYLVDAAGAVNEDEAKGDFGYPSWTGRASFTAAVKNLTFTWQTRWIGDVSQDADLVDEFSDAFDNDGTGFIGDTCTGTGTAFVPGDGVQCRDVGFADDYFIHSASIRYTTDRWEARIGVSNIFNKEPPRVDSDEVFAIANTPIGAGYDYNGREFFSSVKLRF
jgi:iron complex outermembrane receptor protein